MKALDILHCELGTISSRKDGSVRFPIETPELTRDQRADIMDYHGKAARIFIQPFDDAVEEIEQVTSEAEPKTPSQRLRAVLFVWWTQEGKPGSFDEFYRKKMERLIEWVKNKLEPEK